LPFITGCNRKRYALPWLWNTRVVSGDREAVGYVKSAEMVEAPPAGAKALVAVVAAVSSITPTARAMMFTALLRAVRGGCVYRAALKKL
jgi:hypothetical protein